MYRVEALPNHCALNYCSDFLFWNTPTNPYKTLTIHSRRLHFVHPCVPALTCWVECLPRVNGVCFQTISFHYTSLNYVIMLHKLIKFESAKRKNRFNANQGERFDEWRWVLISKNGHWIRCPQGSYKRLQKLKNKNQLVWAYVQFTLQESFF